MTETVDIDKPLGLAMQDLVRRDRARSPGLSPVPGIPPRGPVYPVPVMLLDDCQSGSSCKAAILQADFSTRHNLITVNGDPPDDATFDLLWQIETDENGAYLPDETVKNVELFSTPLEFRERMGEFSFVSDGDIVVGGGLHTRDVGRINEDGELSYSYHPLRWIVSFRGELENETLPVIKTRRSQGSNWSWTSSELTVLTDTRTTIDLWSVVPTGMTVTGKTILKRGAIGMATWVGTGKGRPLGWCLTSLEARNVDLDTLPEVEY